MSKRILIVGGNGFVGSTLARALSGNHTVHCTFRHSYTPIPNVQFHPLSEIADKDRCKALAFKILPEIIIYCVGSNEPEIYDQDQPLAQYVFPGGSGSMLAATEALKPKFIFISSSYVFAGSEGNYAEDDTPLSFSHFGKAKVGAENFVKTRSLNHVLIRCAPLMGRGPIEHPSWVDRWREQLILGKTIQLSSRVLHNPIPIQQLVITLQRVIDQNLKNVTIHLGSLTKLSLLDMGTLFARHYEFNSDLIQPIEKDLLRTFDFTLNFSKTLKLIETQPLFLEQCFDLI